MESIKQELSNSIFKTTGKLLKIKFWQQFKNLCEYKGVIILRALKWLQDSIKNYIAMQMLSEKVSILGTSSSCTKSLKYKYSLIGVGF